jgi:hypothetical protein
MKSVHYLLVVIAMFLFDNEGCCSERLLRETKSVRLYQKLPLLPHASDSYRIEIMGKSYNYVYAGLFLEIPEKHLICFRTEPPLGASYLHVVSTSSDSEEFKIKLNNDSSFGDSLGRKKSDISSTYVDKIEGEEVFFTEHFWRRGQNRYRLNLRLHTLDQIENGERKGP